jgi:hypothetical protein
LPESRSPVMEGRIRRKRRPVPVPRPDPVLCHGRVTPGAQGDAR